MVPYVILVTGIYLCGLYFPVSGSTGSDFLLHGSRLGSFPSPDFTVNFTLHRGVRSFKQIRHGLNSEPLYIRVFAIARDDNNQGFSFDAIGSSQSSPSQSAYGGLIYAYDDEYVRVWAPTAHNGHIIYVKDGWGGERNTQVSDEAVVFVEVWKYFPEPTFQLDLKIDTTRGSYQEVDHELRQLPELVVVKVFPINGKNPNRGFWFPGVAASQNPDSRGGYGGVIFAYNERTVRLWAPHQPQTGCVFIGSGWAGGLYNQHTTQCSVTIQLWVNQLPVPSFRTEWFTFRGQVGQDSFREITHNLGTLPSLVIVQLKAKYGYNKGYVFEGQGAVQSGDDNSDEYGGVAFAYNNESVRLWAPSRNDGSKNGYPLLVKGKSWGNNTSRQDGRMEVLVRVVVYSGKCNESMETAYVGNQCLTTLYMSYIWKIEKRWSDCSSICNSGTQKRALTGCQVTAKKTIHSCDFEKPDLCGWLGSYHGLPGGKISWRRTNTSTPDQQTGPMWGHPKGSFYMYTHSVNAAPLTSAFLKSPLISGANKCHLHFYWSMHGDEVGTLSVEVMVRKTHLDTGWKDSGWSMTGNQGPVFWRAGFVNLEEFGTIYRIRFQHHLPGVVEHVPVCNGTCTRINMAVDSIRLECGVTADELSTKACAGHSVPFAGCPRYATDYNSKGPAYRAETVGSETYVKASGLKHDIIASYDFQVLYPAEYVVWKETFSIDNGTNDISFRVNEGQWYSWKTIRRVAYSVWTQYYFQTFALKPGKHTVTLRQVEFGFRLHRLMLVPRNISMWTDLGMQSCHIPDSFLTAHPKSNSAPAPRFGRLNANGAWCMGDRNPGKGYIYFQVKLPDFALLTRIAIQGDEDQYWIDSFEMKVSLDGIKFTWYREMTGRKRFSGNTNADEVKEHELMFAVPIRAVRIFPIKVKYWICMKVELYGFYVDHGLCSSAVKVPATTQQCAGDRNCGKNAQCRKSVLLNSVHSYKNNTSVDSQEACYCLSGFHGPSCEHNGCSPNNPCMSNATCQDVQNDFTCTCMAGYQGILCQHPCPLGYYGKDCSHKCQCSVHSSCDLATGQCHCERGYNGTYCEDHCVPGSYGYNCEQKCQCRNGASCDSVSGSCNCTIGWTGMFCELRCKRNKWGESCNKNCSCASAALACDRFTGRCVCRDGFIGKFCELECPRGLYGRNCSYLCRCKNSAICSKADGTCNCTTPGLTGVLCDKPCHAGYFGVNCAQMCHCHSRGACDRMTGDCICPVGWTGAKCNKSCPQGYWGRNCTFPCSCTHRAHCNNGRNCSGRCNCPRDVACDHVRGTCRCPAGWQGPMCAQACPVGFYGVDCSQSCTCQNNASCDHVNGTCTCTPGWTGSNCSDPCPNQRYGLLCAGECSCATNFTEPRLPCDHVTGRCNCRPGYQGPSCLEQCLLGTYGKDCRNNCACANGGDCSPSDGTCSCPAGFHGTSCQHTCSPRAYGILCNSTCSCLWRQTKSCGRVDGACSCLRGYTGVLCENTCGEGKFGARCASHCTCQNGAHCDHVNGTCSCAGGYGGRDCSRPCAEGSFGPGCGQKCLCKNGAKCDPITGRCECAPGFLGKLCSVSCDKGRYGGNCSRICDCHTRNTRRCDNGDGSCECMPGFTGARCGEICRKGFYGKDCARTCPVCSRDRINGTCNHTRGDCSCMPGYKGYLCSDDCSLDHYGVHCAGRCKCPPLKLCHHVDGECLDASSGTFYLILRCSVEELETDFVRSRKLKRGLENLMNTYYDRFKGAGGLSSSTDPPAKLPEAGENVTFGRETRSQLAHRARYDFTVRLLGLQEVKLEDEDIGTRAEFVLLNGHTVVDGSRVTAVLERIPREEIETNIAAEVYSGPLYSNSTGRPGIKSHLPLIIGGSAGFLLVVVIIVAFTATHRGHLFATSRRSRKTKKTAADMELQPRHRRAAEPFRLAFQNPYYDIFAAMGLDDDLEEEFYNPLYEDGSLCSDSTDDSYHECLSDMVIR